MICGDDRKGAVMPRFGGCAVRRCSNDVTIVSPLIQGEEIQSAKAYNMTALRLHVQAITPLTAGTREQADLLSTNRSSKRKPETCSFPTGHSRPAAGLRGLGYASQRPAR